MSDFGSLQVFSQILLKDSKSWSLNWVFHFPVSNSLIIHQVKTKKITTMKKVWIRGLNKHRFWKFYLPVYSLVFVLIEKKYQTLTTVFHQLSKHLKFHQKYSPPHRFSTLFSMFGYPDETLSLRFDILIQRTFKSSASFQTLTSCNQT